LSLGSVVLIPVCLGLPASWNVDWWATHTAIDGGGRKERSCRKEHCEATRTTYHISCFPKRAETSRPFPLSYLFSSRQPCPGEDWRLTSGTGQRGTRTCHKKGAISKLDIDNIVVSRYG
jgi:hypothetical protein